LSSHGALLADEFDKLGADLMLLPDIAELEHIAFLQHPAAETHAAEDHGFAAVVDDLRSFDLQKAFGVRRGRGKQRDKRERDGAEVHDLIPIFDLWERYQFSLSGQAR